MQDVIGGSGNKCNISLSLYKFFFIIINKYWQKNYFENDIRGKSLQK